MVTNYRILEKIYESNKTSVYRGTTQPDNQPTILKILKENYPSVSDREHLTFAITRNAYRDQ